jgi:hypothetical protein
MEWIPASAGMTNRLMLLYLSDLHHYPTGGILKAEGFGDGGGNHPQAALSLGDALRWRLPPNQELPSYKLNYGK